MREDLKLRILQHAQSKTRELGFVMSSVVQSDLTEFINQGIDRMSTSEYNSATDRLRAERNIETLINSMSRDAKSRNLYERLDYSSFTSAKSSICPLWPFC